MELKFSAVVRQANDQVSCALDEEIVILHLGSSVYFGLDGVGACIWETLRQPIKVDEICRNVIDRFDVSEEKCRADVLDFLDKLEKAGLVEIVSCDE